jgi:hypothetical protein
VVRRDLDALDQQADDARLLGREQLVPNRFYLLHRTPTGNIGDANHLKRFTSVRECCIVFNGGTGEILSPDFPLGNGMRHAIDDEDDYGTAPD